MASTVGPSRFPSVSPGSAVPGSRPWSPCPVPVGPSRFPLPRERRSGVDDDPVGARHGRKGALSLRATLDLMPKPRPNFSASVLCGDQVVVKGWPWSFGQDVTTTAPSKAVLLCMDEKPIERAYGASLLTDVELVRLMGAHKGRDGSRTPQPALNRFRQLRRAYQRAEKLGVVHVLREANLGETELTKCLQDPTRPELPTCILGVGATPCAVCPSCIELSAARMEFMRRFLRGERTRS